MTMKHGSAVEVPEEAPTGPAATPDVGRAVRISGRPLLRPPARGYHSRPPGWLPPEILRIALADIVADMSLDARMKMHDIRHHMQRYSGSREAKEMLRARLVDEFLAAVATLEQGGDPAEVRGRLDATREVFADFSDHDESMDDAFDRILGIVFSSLHAQETRRLALAELVREEVAYFHRDLRRLPADRLVFSASFDPWIEADPVHVRRVVDNLITNGAEAIVDADGAVRVDVDVHAVLEERTGVLGPIPPGNYASLTGHDDGTGLDPAVTEKIFRAGYSSKPDHAGLGLTYVRQAVEDAGGYIEVLAEEQQGTAIRVYLPLVEPPST
jgi:signal transduction histidine kinase